MIDIPEFHAKSDLYDWLISNKSLLIAQKKSMHKKADPIGFGSVILTDRGDAVKSEVISSTATRIKVRSIINTTKLFDSHMDVHIDQLWNKSLKETKQHYLVNDHNLSFDGVISDEVKAFTKQMSWAELGFNYEGNTQALVYDSVIEKDESPMMFDKYRKGKVREHSVYMRYIKTDLAVNDDRYETEKKLWDKYYPSIANKEDVMENGYFYAVTEAKNIEGSAVVRGSNFATPTYSVEEKTEPSDTQEEPLDSTQKLDVNELLSHYKL